MAELKKKFASDLFLATTFSRLYIMSDHPEVSVVGQSSVTVMEGEDVTLTCQVMSAPEPVVTWLFNGTDVNTSSDSYAIAQISTTDGEYSLTINSVTTSNTGTYTCQVNNTAIPEVVTGDIALTVNSKAPVAVYAVIGVMGVGGVLFVTVFISLILWPAMN